MIQQTNDNGGKTALTQRASFTFRPSILSNTGQAITPKSKHYSHGQDSPFSPLLAPGLAVSVTAKKKFVGSTPKWDFAPSLPQRIMGDFHLPISPFLYITRTTESRVRTGVIEGRKRLLARGWRGNGGFFSPRAISVWKGREREPAKSWRCHVVEGLIFINAPSFLSLSLSSLVGGSNSHFRKMGPRPLILIASFIAPRSS